MPSKPFGVSRRALLALGGAGLAAACGGPRGGLTFVSERPNVGAIEPILVATTREFVQGQPVFTAERIDEPAFYRFEVSVPPEREIGSVRFPESYPPDPRTDFLTVSARRLAGEGAFVAAIDAELATSADAEFIASVFVHGYNTNFAEGLYRHAQLLKDYGRPQAAVHFAWPSAATAQGYVFDRESALFSRDALERTLSLMARSDARGINIIAHSMGAFLAMDALRTMARVGFDEVFAKTRAVMLISPDIDIDLFRKQARPVVERGVPVFVVVSTRDRALLISARLRGEQSRVGSIESPEQLGDIDVTVIDITDVNAGGGMGHFALARSPELIALIRGIRAQGIDVLESGDQRGIIESGVSVVRQGTELVLSPLTR